MESKKPSTIPNNLQDSIFKLSDADIIAGDLTTVLSDMFVHFELTRFAQPCIHTDTLSVLLSALYLYLLPRVLIWRRMRTSGAGSSLFCALTVE
jgi:hypothetical protein